MEALGASYRSPTSETDFKSAVVDGFVVPAVERAGNPNGATSVTTNISFGPMSQVVFGDADGLAGLSEDDRTILREAARATVDVQNGTDYTAEAESIGQLCRGGEVSFDEASPAQIDDLRSKLEPVYRWLREDQATSDFIDRISQLSESSPADPQVAAAVDCPQAPHTAIPAAVSPIDGTYSITSTLDDLKAFGAPPIDWVPENWGESVYVFDRGRFASTQHNDLACTWSFGRFVVDGDLLTLYVDDGGGLAPNDAANRPGELFGFGWSLYRDVLSLSAMQGHPSPMVSGHTWPLQQVSATPDPSALNQQCPPPARAFPA